MDFKIPDTPEELLRQGGKQFNKMNKFMPLIVGAFILFFFIMTSFYSVGPDEVGVVRRFGKYLKTTQPGLQWKIPFGVDKLDLVRVKRVFKEEFGFRTLEAGVNTRYSTKSYDDESLMLTGDLNVLDVSWIVQFKIKDAAQLLFNVRNPGETVRDLSESVMRQEIGDSSVTEAITNRRIELNQTVQKKLQDILDQYGAGVHIDTVKLQDVNYPDKVKISVNEVDEAKQEKEKVINQSKAAYNEVIPKARGEAEQTLRESEGYALARVKKSQGDAARFVDTWTAYKEAKDVTRKRMYLETMREAIPKAGQIFVFEPDAGGVLPLMNLGGKEIK